MESEPVEQTTVTKHWVYFIRPTREGFFENPTKEEMSLVSEHAKYLRDLVAKGVVILAGPCEDPNYYPKGTPESVPFQHTAPGIVVFEAVDLEAAKEILERDPAIRAGFFKACLNTFTLAMQRE